MKKYKKKQDGIRIHQFLMGLDNQRFGTTRSNLLTRLHDLNLESVYSQIVQEERHIQATRESQEKGRVVDFSVSAAGSFKQQTSTCSHCGKTGHEKSQCYKIVGYPEWWNEPSYQNGGRGYSGRGHGSSRGRGRGWSSPMAATHVSSAVTTTASSSASSVTGLPQLTDNQLSTLADFIEKSKKSNGASKDGYSAKSVKLVLYGTHSRFNVIIDSGASHHMTGDINLLIEIHKIDPSSRTLIGAGTERDGVYHLAGVVIPQINRVGTVETRDLWHKRMGHPSPKVLSFL
ncbi:unnamed protein product [Arabidopsis halleri]